MKIIVSITDGKRTYSEDVTEEEKESFEECSKNGANPWLNNFDRYTRELPEFELRTDLLAKYNTKNEEAHFIFGWYECFFQSDDVSGWMYDPGSRLKIKVKHET